MYKPFFPHLGFAWIFLLFLGFLLAVAAYIDWRRMVIPKGLTLSLGGVGLVVSTVRGAWLGVQGDSLWLLESGSAWRGGLDGLIFALVGALGGFAMIFVLWVLGTCGGGDVKLIAGLGTWLGPIYTLLVFVVSLGVLVVAVLLKALTVGLRPLARPGTLENQASQKNSGGPPEKWRITYSFPVALACLIVLLLVFRGELRLPQGVVTTTEVKAHVP